MPKKPKSLNQFQSLIRIVDTAKSGTTGASLAFSKHLDVRKNNLTAGTFQIGFSVITLVGLIGRIIEDPSRLRTNTTGILLRMGIITIDAVSGALLIADSEEKTPLSIVGKSLQVFSLLASRAVGEDGHHDEEIEEDEEKPLLKKNYGGVAV